MPEFVHSSTTKLAGRRTAWIIVLCSEATSTSFQMQRRDLPHISFNNAEYLSSNCHTVTDAYSRLTPCRYCPIAIRRVWSVLLRNSYKNPVHIPPWITSRLQCLVEHTMLWRLPCVINLPPPPLGPGSRRAPNYASLKALWRLPCSINFPSLSSCLTCHHSEREVVRFATELPPRCTAHPFRQITDLQQDLFVLYLGHENIAFELHCTIV